MDNVISEYRKWKEQGDTLRARAKQAMESRFHELILDAVQIAQDYEQDFGAPIKPPAQVTAFSFKPAAKSVPKPAAKTAAAPNPKALAVEKRLAAARKKLEAAKAAGQPTKTLEDKIYEIEDELRLANQAV